MARHISIWIELEAPDDSMFALDELRAMVEANLATWEFNAKRVADVQEGGAFICPVTDCPFKEPVS